MGIRWGKNADFKVFYATFILHRKKQDEKLTTDSPMMKSNDYSSMK